MRVTRTITASLAAVLGAAALTGPAAADSLKQPDSWYAGKSTIEGSTHSGQQGANDSVKAHVYVPPTGTSSDTAAPANDSWYAGKSTIEGSTHSGQQGANDSVKANVYVPPTGTSSDTAAPANDSAKANLFVPPDPQPIQRHVPATSASSWDFDWSSAGIGIAVASGAFLIALGGAAGLRRRRQMQPAATG